MKLSPWLILVFVTTHSLLCAQNSTFGSGFSSVWQRASKYTLETAEAMPEDLYSFRPSDSLFTFEEQLIHLEQNLWSLSNRFVEEKRVEWPRQKAGDRDKQAIIADIQSALNHVQGLITGLSEEEMSSISKNFWGPDPTSKAGIILLMRDHMTHHRAQMILYLRLNGIEPPRYRGW